MITMVLAILIVVIILWYSYRTLDNARLSEKEGTDRQRIEMQSTVSPAMHERSVAKAVVSYFDLVNEKQTVRAYKKLVNEYESGLISVGEFHEKMESLIEKIDINEIALKREERQKGD